MIIKSNSLTTNFIHFRGYLKKPCLCSQRAHTIAVLREQSLCLKPEFSVPSQTLSSIKVFNSGSLERSIFSLNLEVSVTL